jgi:hypothetical protein
MCLSQESIAEKIYRLDGVGDPGGNKPLVKSVFAMGWK